MEGRRLVLNDGTEIENGEAGYANQRLWCFLPGYTIQAAAAIFFDAGKTAKIVFQYGEMQDEYNGFTNCVNLMQEETRVCVCLTKGNVNAVA